MPHHAIFLKRIFVPKHKLDKRKNHDIFDVALAINIHPINIKFGLQS